MNEGQKHPEEQEERARAGIAVEGEPEAEACDGEPLSWDSLSWDAVVRWTELNRRWAAVNRTDPRFHKLPTHRTVGLHFAAHKTDWPQ